MPVLLEKPFANTTDECFAFVDKLSSLPDGGAKLVNVGFNRAFDPAARAAAGWSEGGLIGDLQQSLLGLHHRLERVCGTGERLKTPGISPALEGGQTGGTDARIAVGGDGGRTAEHVEALHHHEVGGQDVGVGSPSLPTTPGDERGGGPADDEEARTELHAAQ